MLDKHATATEIPHAYALLYYRGRSTEIKAEVGTVLVTERWCFELRNITNRMF